MKNGMRLITTSLILLSFLMFYFYCGTEDKKPKGEVQLKNKINEFHLTMDTLQLQLKQKHIKKAKTTFELLKKITKGIVEAEIPERLAPKAKKIKNQKANLTASVDNLSKFFNQPNITKIDSVIMNAFHQMYKNWKKINDEIRIEVPEMTMFHDVLGPVWHVHYVKNDIEAIKKAAPKLKEKAAVLDNVKWPQILLEEEDLELLNENAIELKKAVDEFVAVCQSDDTVVIKKMTAKVKLKYQNIKMMQ